MKKTTPEQDLRLDLLNTLLTTPHRQFDALQPLHAEMVKKDPRFYVRLAAWYNDHGEVRDHKEMFIITLVLSDFEGHRDAGLAMLRALPPYQVVRVVDFVHGKHKVLRARPASKQKMAASAAPAPATMQKTGLFRTAARGVRRSGRQGARREQARTGQGGETRQRSQGGGGRQGRRRLAGDAPQARSRRRQPGQGEGPHRAADGAADRQVGLDVAGHRT